MEFDRALEYYMMSLEMKKKIGTSLGIMQILSNISQTYIGKGEFDRALEYLNNAYEIQKKVDDPWSLITIYHFYAEAYYGKKDFKNALKYCNRTLDISEKVFARRYYSKSRKTLGKIYREQERWNDSIENFSESIMNLKKIGMMNELAESHFEFGLMWKAKGNPDKAKEELNKALDIFNNIKLEKKAGNVKMALESLQTPILIE